MKIEVYSYLNGSYTYDNTIYSPYNGWTKNNERVTKYPPKEGTCKVTDDDGIVIYAGDVKKLLEDNRNNIKELFKDFSYD